MRTNKTIGYEDSPKLNRRLVVSAVIIYELIQLLLMIAVIALQVDALNNRVLSDRQRNDLKVQNEYIEKQNKYKICLLESIWDTEPQDRTLAAREECRAKTLGSEK